MIHSYFVAYNYLRHGENVWHFANAEVTTLQPMEQAAVREEVTQNLVTELITARPGLYTVVISGWILETSDFSAEVRAARQQSFLETSAHDTTRMVYFVAYNNNPIGTSQWHFGNVVVEIDQHIEVDFARDYVVRLIEADLARRHGGEHIVVISNWKLLWRKYPEDTRALSKC